MDSSVTQFLFGECLSFSLVVIDVVLNPVKSEMSREIPLLLVHSWCILPACYVFANYVHQKQTCKMCRAGDESDDTGVKQLTIPV